MTKTQKEGIIKDIKEVARKVISEHKEITPHAIIMANGKPEFMSLLSGKEYECMSIAIKLLGISEYYVVNDVWVAEYKRKSGIYVNPSSNPNKTEAIAITHIVKPDTEKTILIPYERKEGKITFGEEREIESDSKFNAFIERDAFIEKNDKAVREITDL